MHTSYDIMVAPGTTSEFLHREIAPSVLFSSEEEAKISESKEVLSERLPELQRIKEMYLMALRLQQDKVQMRVTVHEISGESQELSPAELWQYYTKCQELFLGYVHFLVGKFSALYGAKQFVRAEAELKALLQVVTQAYGPHHIETLKIKLDYALAQCALFVEERPILLREVVGRLAEVLADKADDHSVKEALARGDYILAQDYFKHKQIALATTHLDRSERLRREYGEKGEGGLERQLDRIRFLHALMAEAQGRPDEAARLLTECYRFRKSLDRRHFDLIAVLQELINLNFGGSGQIPPNQLEYRKELLELQKYHHVDERDIIHTQLMILRMVKEKLDGEEFWTLLDGFESQLDRIPVTEENIRMGQCYFLLAEIRTEILFPQDWSHARTQDYCSKTLALIEKAQSHLQSLIGTRFLSPTTLQNLRDKCVSSIAFWERRESFLRFVPPHPEDEAELLFAATGHQTPTSGRTRQELQILSEFSSEVCHPLGSEDRLLTPADFEALPEEGTINPCKLRVAQGGINPEFRDGKSLQDTKKALAEDPLYTHKIPAVEIGLHEGKIYSFDTRRLIVHQQAREDNPHVVIRYRKISGPHLAERIEAVFSPRPWNGIVTALRYGGVGSESAPYINPTFRPQLEERVARDFRPFPSDREGADENGFPIKQKQAKKIFNFLSERAEAGSKWATEKLAEANVIYEREGRGEAFYDFLIAAKAESEGSRVALSGLGGGGGGSAQPSPVVNPPHLC